MNVVRNENGYLFALTYDADTDWVRNVLAAGGCERRRAGAIQLVLPHQT